MFTEIKKANWVRYCKQFNRANQYRRADVTIVYESTDSVVVMESSLFLGLSVSRKGRSIEEISLIVGRSNPDMMVEPIASIYRPVTISLKKDDQGIDSSLMIIDGDGNTVSLSLSGEQNPQFRHSLNEEIAHSVFERRGSGHGYDLEDWLQAESIIVEAEHELV